jgi:hypothetical protein
MEWLKSFGVELQAVCKDLVMKLHVSTHES